MCRSCCQQLRGDRVIVQPHWIEALRTPANASRVLFALTSILDVNLGAALGAPTDDEERGAEASPPPAPLRGCSTHPASKQLGLLFYFVKTAPLLRVCTA